MFFSKKAKDYFFKTKKKFDKRAKYFDYICKKVFFMEENDKKEYRNWYKRLLRIQKKELILFGVLILLAFIFVGISSDICKWLKTKVIYDIVKNNCCINIPICIIISGFAIWWWTKIWKDKDIRPYRLGIIISLFIITYYSKVKYANITENISYEHFFIAILGISAIIIIIRLCLSHYFTCKSLSEWYLNENRFKRLKQIINPLIYKQDKEPELKGFSVDNTEIKLEDNQIKYAETLVKKLKNTDLSKESFAVGITGEWGSGKSTFLNTMKEKIGKDFAEIVEFNPWLCNSPEQVTQDFFATLIDKLSPKHSTLSRDINKYAKLLNKIAKASLSFFGIDLDLTPSDDSLNKLKDKISNKLANLPKKVVILIDDTDRLEGNEVFEILRLIRNTADFKNVIYIATYDKEYVTDVLKGNKIKDPSAYLEKIFQVEVHLLKVEGSELWDTWKEEIEKQLNSINSITISITTLNTLIKPHTEFIMRVLTNYRQVKRFARQFAVYLDYLNSINLINELYTIDLFWIELLQMYDKETYDTLAKDYTRLLNDSNDHLKLQLKTEQEDISLKLKDETLNILNIIFPKDNNTDIQYKANYDKYFSLNISPFEVSMIEYITAISYSGADKINNAKATINRWVNIEKKHDDSIITRFNNSTQYLLGIIYYENCLSLILHFALITDNFNKIKFILVQNKEFSDIDKKRISEFIKKWFNSEIDNYESNEKLIRLSEFLNQMYHYYTINGEGYILNNPKYFIDNEKIEELLLSIMSKLIDNNNINDIDFSKIYRNCIAVNEDLQDISGERIDIEYKQLPIFRKIFDNFSNQNKTPLIKDGRYPTFAEFKVEYNNMLKEIKNK